MPDWSDGLRQYCLQLISRLKPAIPPPEEELPLLDQCEILLNNLNVDWFINYKAVYGIGITLPMAYSTIDKYTNELHDLIEVMRINTLVLPGSCRWTPQPVKLNDFFLSEDLFYQDIHFVIRLFREAALLLCQAIRLAEDVTPESGTYNRRLLSPLLNNIKGFTITLAEISLPT